MTGRIGRAAGAATRHTAVIGRTSAAAGKGLGRASFTGTSQGGRRKPACPPPASAVVVGRQSLAAAEEVCCLSAMRADLPVRSRR